MPRAEPRVVCPPCSSSARTTLDGRKWPSAGSVTWPATGLAWSGGSEPETEINRAAVVAMAKAGVDISGAYAKSWTEEALSAADVVVTMGCADACPLVPGKGYEDWQVEDPAGLPLSVVWPIRDEIEQRVRDLLARLGVPPAAEVARTAGSCG